MGWLSKKSPEEKRDQEQKKIRRTNQGGDKYGLREQRRGEERAALYRRSRGF
ncbi:hypothetical protein [Streptosporangium sp. V21-05]|uniref:hypothetical protein n=1 Tax=Streptosporangium sp. V21-05 TaxID=3446115 RepID=UPI003F52967D